MTKFRRATKFICNDCNLAFELLNPLAIGRNERKHCPNCGDYFAVEVLKTKNKQGDTWDDEELELLDQHINGEITGNSLVYLLGRTEKSIYLRKSRRIRETGVGKNPHRWSDEEKELAIKCANGEMDVWELSKKTGRSYYGAERFVRRMRKEE